MRRPIFSFFLIAFLAYFFVAPDTADAQTKGRAGLKYHTHIEQIGISAGVDIAVAEMIRAAGDFTYYLSQDDGGGDLSFWTIDLNALYALLENDSMTVHGVGGINILQWNWDYNVDIFGKGFNVDTSATDVGLNLGALAEFGSGEGLGFWASALISGLGSGSSGLALGGGVTIGF